MEHFWNGFEKQAGGAEMALAGGALAGLGALSGHQMHVMKKIIHARQGKDYKEKSFIDRHPKLTGALSLGIAPTASAMSHQKELDSENKKVRSVKAEHPFVTQNM